IQQRGLPGTVGTDDTEDLACGNREGDAIDDAATSPLHRDLVDLKAHPAHLASPFSARPIRPATRMTSGSGTFFTQVRTASVAPRIIPVGRSPPARRPRPYAAPAIAPVAAPETPSTNARTDAFSATRW